MRFSKILKQQKIAKALVRRTVNGIFALAQPDQINYYVRWNRLVLRVDGF